MQKTNMDYGRVIPRDLFNEAKVLKCMGQLCLKILDNMTPAQMHFEFNSEGFQVGLMDEGALTIANLQIFVKGRQLLFKTIYNSKANYPLYVEFDSEDILVFAEDGHFADEFITLCKHPFIN